MQQIFNYIEGMDWFDVLSMRLFYDLKFESFKQINAICLTE